MNSFYNVNELLEIGFKSFGQNVQISRNAKFYNPSKIVLGNNVRIDDFCILSGNITIGNNVHISASSLIFAGDAGVIMEDYSGLSSRSAIYAVSDDYSGSYMTNPTIDEKYRNVIEKQVIIGKHSLIGTNSTVLPGVKIGKCSAIGAMSLVNKNVDDFSICVGIPCIKIKERKKELLELEKQYIKEIEQRNEG